MRAHALIRLRCYCEFSLGVLIMHPSMHIVVYMTQTIFEAEMCGGGRTIRLADHEHLNKQNMQ